MSTPNAGARGRVGSSPSVSLVGILAALPAVVWEADGSDYRMTFVSPRALDLLGHDPADWVGMPTFWEDHLHPDDRDRAVHEVDAALAARVPGQVDYRFRHADGSYRWFRDAFSVVEDADGCLRLTGLMQDITAEHAAGDARLVAEAERDRLVQAVEQSADSILVSSADGRIAFVNGGFERNTGYLRAEALGQYPEFVVAPPDREATRARIKASLSSEGRWSGEVVIRRRDGTTYREAVAVSLLRDAAGGVVGTVAAGRDVTREREVEAQLAQAARMEAVGQLAGGIAHDFNNLLTAILGYGSMLGDALDPASLQAADLAEIMAAARRAQALTAQLLAFGRRALLQPRIVDASELVAGLVPMLDRLIGEDVALEVDAQPGHRALIDAGQLEQAVVNLVVNARDAMPRGGAIKVAVRGATGADLDAASGMAPLPPEALDPRRWVAVEVDDDGVGMADEVRARAFEPFFTTKPVGHGTGLGLAMVDGFIRQSGGGLAVVTAPGAGTRITLLLPVADGTERDPLPVAPARPVDQGRLTVLVVEDDVSIRRLATRALADAGHEVLEAASGEAALAVVAAFRGSLDLLFTDIVMPGISGPMLAAELKGRFPGIRVVLASGYSEAEVARRGFAVTADGFLHKPYTPGELLAAVRSDA